MPNTISSRVISLLAQWEERKEAGEALSPEELCKNSPELLNQVKAQLELLNDFPNHSDSTGDFDPDLTTDDQPAKTTFKDLTGTIIANRYRLTKLVGEGGMGSVWQAEQSQPVKRQVALKLIRNTTRTSAQVIRRFEAERQALALMDHPGIARIYDGGVTEWKDPYFVMELVPGVPLTEYCDDKRLSVKQRLELFVNICQAVQHAHQKGIIHRDLKPGNILVTEVDGKPEPKVIDFGVAKATEQKLTEETINDFGAVVGTLAYMSPEQADASTVDIDTRTDVYALGVILFELLAGSTPLDTKQYKKMALRELLRLISDVEPPRLVAKLSSAENLPNLAASRSTEPAQLTKAVQGDLEWIVLKALEKDRTRRYETATGFAADVQRHLSGEAVLAHPPSGWYLMRKFVKRNRLQVVAAGLVATALIVGIIGTTIGYYRAEDAAEKEKSSRLNEQQERVFAQAIANFVKDDFLALTSVAGQVRFDGKGLDRNSTLLDLLNRAAVKLKERKDLSPRAEAELCWIVGVNYVGASVAEKGLPFLERAAELRKSTLGVTHETTLISQNSLATAYGATGQLDKALPLLENTLEAMRSKLGPEHPTTLACIGNLGMAYRDAGQHTKALPLLEVALKITETKAGAEHPDTLTCISNLASCYQDAGLLDKSLPLLEKTMRLRKLKLGPSHPDTIISINNLAAGYQFAGMLDKALPLYDLSLKLTKEKLGAEHFETCISMSNLAGGYLDAGQFDKSLPLFKNSLKSIEAKLGAEHPHTLSIKAGLANAYLATNQPQLALPYFQETYKLMMVKLGPDHSHTLICLSGLAKAYQATNQLDKAIPLLEKSYKARKAKFGPDHHETLSSMNDLGGGYQAINQLDKALPLFEESLKLQRAKSGATHSATLLSMSNLAQAYLAVNQIDKALPLMEETLKVQRTIGGTEHPHTIVYMQNLARGYQAAGKLNKALPLFEEAALEIEKKQFDHIYTGHVIPNTIAAYNEAKQYDRAATWQRKWLNHIKATSGTNTPAYVIALVSLGNSLLLQQKYTEAEPVLRESLAIREKSQPDVWSTFNTKSLLGGSLLGQKKYADSEPLLIDGYSGMKKREKMIPLQANTRLPEALDRLIQLYTETNKPDEVKKWQAEKKRLTEQSSGKKE